MPHTVLRAFPAFLTCLSLLVLATPSTAEVDGYSIRIDPLQPLPGQDFLIVVEGETAGTVELEDLQFLDEGFGGGLFEVTLRQTCLPDCVVEPFRIEIPVAGSEMDLPADDYGLRVLRGLDFGAPPPTTPPSSASSAATTGRS